MKRRGRGNSRTRLDCRGSLWWAFERVERARRHELITHHWGSLQGGLLQDRAAEARLGSNRAVTAMMGRTSLIVIVARPHVAGGRAVRIVTSGCSAGRIEREDGHERDA